MTGEEQSVRHEGRETASPVLEALVPLAAVIGAGCEPCAERRVAQALAHEDARPLVAPTLAILAGVAAAKCFADAVGTERVDRMKRSLRSARLALDRSRSADTNCCG